MSEDSDWKERYRKDPTTRAVVDLILSKHPEIGGNVWLAEDIAKGFIQGSEAMHQQLMQLQQCFLDTAQTAMGRGGSALGLGNFIHDSIEVEINEATAAQFQAAFALPKPEPITPDRLLAALAKQPELLLAVKDLMMDVRVAGPWVDFNDSDYAKMKRVSFPQGTLVRLTPDRGNTSKMESVIKVSKRFEPRLPNRHQMDEDWEWAEQVKEHEAQVEDWEVNPYGWRIDMVFQSMFPMEGRQGFATTFEEAKRAADEVLRAAGWVLVES